MRGASGGPGALVAEEFLDDPERHAPLQEMGRLGVPQGMDGGLFGDPTLAHHRCERLLAGGGRQRCRAAPGGEHPGAGPLALPVLPQSRQHPRGSRHAAVFAPLALVYPHEPPWRIDVGDLQLCALGQTQPTGVDHLQTHPGFRVLDQGQ
jgi:hypothetical protein